MSNYPIFVYFPTVSPVRYYRIEATQVKRTLKNKLIKIAKPVSKNNQDGVTYPQTMLMDLKKIEDVISVIGFIPAQDINTIPSNIVSERYNDVTQTSAIDTFESLVNDFKRSPGNQIFVYNGKEYSVVIEQLEHTDRSNRLQKSSVNYAVSSSPERVDVSISFVVGVA